MVSSLLQIIRKGKEPLILQHLLDFLIPPRCLMCNQVVSESGRVCVDCFKTLDFITDPCCRLCARPFISNTEAGKDFVCAECSSAEVAWHQCRAAFLYNDGFKKLIMPLKYGDQQKALGFLSHFMYRSAQGFISHVDYIIPVPLHKKRLRYRKYNQSALLAWQLEKMSHIPVLPMGLVRIRETAVLGHLNKQERQYLLKDAFIVHPKYKNLLKEKHVLLIDDVMTTGSTLTECALTLLSAEVACVDILVTAKVVAK